MIMECPFLNVACPQKPSKKRFWAGAIEGANGKASTAKSIVVGTFLLICASWFCFSERSIQELTYVLIIAFGYIGYGKREYRLREKSSNDDIKSTAEEAMAEMVGDGETK